ncbi:MAG: hypothetical protein AAF495_13125 [Pseudomonadota bacterium]
MSENDAKVAVEPIGLNLAVGQIGKEQFERWTTDRLAVNQRAACQAEILRIPDVCLVFFGVQLLVEENFTNWGRKSPGLGEADFGEVGQGRTGIKLLGLRWIVAKKKKPTHGRCR